MIDIVHPTKYKSTNILAIGFVPEADGRGRLYVQFHDGEGKLTSQGYYKEVQVALYNALNRDRAPSSFLSKNLKPHFEWVAVLPDEPPEIAAARANPDLTLPDDLYIQADTPNNEAAINAVIDAQRTGPKPGLFT